MVGPVPTYSKVRPYFIPAIWRYSHAEFDRPPSARTRALSIRSGLWLVALLSLPASCQPSVHASAEGPVEPETPPPASTGTPAVTDGASATTPTTPSDVASAPAASTPAPVNTAAPSAPATSAAPTTAASTGLPTTIPTTLPTTLPTAFPTAVPPAETTPPPATADANGKVRTEGDRILLPGNIVFESGKTILSPTPENQTVLKQLQKFLTDTPKVSQIRIEGYTDNVGKAESNLKLSGERALAIKQWLVAQGVAADRVLAVGFGQEKPVADNGTPAGRAQNRRTEFKIAAVNGRPYRGVPVLGGGTEFSVRDHCFLPRVITRGSWLLVGSFWIGCQKAPSDLREWTPKDHTNQSNQAAGANRQVAANPAPEEAPPPDSTR